MNYLVKVNSNYTTSQKLRVMPPEDYQKFYDKYKDYFRIDNPFGEYASLDDGMMPISVFQEMQEEGWDVYITKVKGLSYDKNFKEHDKVAVQNTPVTNITQVSVANDKLLSITDVTWLENACTQELQGFLDEGWRILAVCPSNDQRRPDYILGK